MPDQAFPLAQNKNLIVLLCVLLTAWGLSLRYANRAAQEFAGDEAWQTIVMRGSPGDMIGGLAKQEFCGYLSGNYFLVYPFFKLFGPNKWGVAIPSILSTVLGFYFLYLVGRRIFKNFIGFLVAFSIMGFNATMVFHSFESRVYGILPTLTLATYLLSDTLMNDYRHMNSIKKRGIGLFFIAVILFHVYGILILFVTVSYLLCTRIKMPGFRHLFMFMIKFFSLILLLALPLWIYSVLIKHADYNPNLGGTFRFIANPLADPLSFLKSVFGNLLGHKPLYFLFAGLLGAFLIPHQDRFKQMGFFLICIIFPILLNMISDMRTQYWFLQRQFIWVMPYFAVLTGWCWESVFEKILQKAGSKHG